ncbi:MAG: hypothetical protein MI802_23750 [Desulfobacterales bacterium]|nr:hypothetical protein [Desulfobacterales bacterium]
MSIDVFTSQDYKSRLDALAGAHDEIRKILEETGYPPFWERPTGFEGLVRIILEQQVSLPSAFSVYRKLKSALHDFNPESVIRLADEDLRSLGLTRQKSRYIRILAEEIMEGRLDLNTLEALPDHEVKKQLTAITGIGPWTADIYLLMGLHRADLFPVGDLALRNAMKGTGLAAPDDDHPTLERKAAAYAPHRSLFSFLLWHWYIKKQNIKLPPA